MWYCFCAICETNCGLSALPLCRKRKHKKFTPLSWEGINQILARSDEVCSARHWRLSLSNVTQWWFFIIANYSLYFATVFANYSSCFATIIANYSYTSLLQLFRILRYFNRQLFLIVRYLCVFPALQ